MKKAMLHILQRYRFLLFSFILTFLSFPSLALDPITKERLFFNFGKEIVFGQTGILSGHFKQYAAFIREGILACFESVNQAGGVHDKQLRLISMDDFGRPQQAEQNIKIFKDAGVDMFLGNMGSRSIIHTLPMIKNKEIAVLFPWGGDNKFFDQELSNIINGLGFLQPQIEQLVTYTIADLGISKIAIFHADDIFSTNARNLIVLELAKHGIKPVSVAEYNRYTLDIDNPVSKLLDADPKAVICLATSTPTIKLVNSFFEKGYFGTTFLGIDSTFLARDVLAAKGVHFFFSSAVPDPLTSELEIAKKYYSDLKKINPTAIPNILSFAYYISAQLVVMALQNSTPPFTKEKIIAYIENLKNFNIYGMNISFDKQTRHAFGKKISILKG